jgi:uncharacterized integral membrane protein
MSDPKVSDGGGGVRLQPRTVAAGVVTILALIFIAQNREEGTIEFLFLDVDVGLWLALAVTFLLGIAVGWLLRRSRES